MSTNTAFILDLPALHSRLFDNVARLWYGEISSHHYLPLLISLFRVGVSLFHIHNKKTAGNKNKLLTNTPNKITATILHCMHVP